MEKNLLYGNNKRVKAITIAYILLFTILYTLTGCKENKIAKEYSNDIPIIFPDYTGATLPRNIAPPNFTIEEAELIKAEFSYNGNNLYTVYGKEFIDIDPQKWNEITSAIEDSAIEIAVSVWNNKHKDGIKYKPFKINISKDSIDSYLVYRLIEPGYEGWNQLGIYQRNMSTFEEEAIITNQSNKSTCINCHSFTSNNTDNFMFHARGENGGTIIVQNQDIKKIAIEKLKPFKGATYPSWHPSGKYIAFSSNVTRQSFFDEGIQQIEVYDLESDLMIYDTEKNSIITDSLFLNKENLETFPAWSNKGDKLYFCSAKAKAIPSELKEIRYSLFSVNFNHEQGCIYGKTDTLYNAEKNKCSISFPKPSPDGKYILCTKSDYGTFPIQHHEADLIMFDTKTGNEINCQILNSNDTESYHSWSSNSKWIVFSSRRIDGRFTRIFISHIDNNGNISKPFLLPQKNPRYNTLRLKSYNIPELIKNKMYINKKEIEKLIR